MLIAGGKMKKMVHSNKQRLEELDTLKAEIVELKALVINANITLFNHFTKKLTGYKKQEMLGQNWFKLFIPKRNEFAIPQLFYDIMPEAFSYENSVICLDSSERKHTEEKLKKHSQTLEKMVKTRTSELEAKNRGLDNTLKVFIDSELLINIWQNKINNLNGGVSIGNKDTIIPNPYF